MTLLFIGIALLLSALAGTIAFVQRRPSAVVSLQPRPETHRNIRVLHNDHEIRDAARRAYERECFIADAADRRAAHFRDVASNTPRNPELAAGD